MVCFFQLLNGIEGAPEGIFRVDRHLHVGLAGAHPYFADQDIVQRDRRHSAVTSQRERVRSARLHRREFGEPFAVGFGGDATFPACEGKCYESARLRLAGEPDRPLPLENHMRGEDTVKGEFSGEFHDEKLLPDFSA